MRRLQVLILLSLLTCFSQFSVAQTTGNAQINGKVRKDNKPCGEVTIQIVSSGAASQTVTSKDNGSFTFTLDLQKKYSITFSKAGLVTKLIDFSTVVPPDQADIIFQFDFNVDLFDDIAGVSQKNAMNKPVARIAYNPTYENFMDDETYTKQIKSEQEIARKEAEDIHRVQERSRLDSLNKIWNDSLARVKSRESQLMAEKAEQDRRKAEQEKARKDSTDRANLVAQISAAAAAKEKARADSLAQTEIRARALAEAAEKNRLDSIKRAEAENYKLEQQRITREKARQDSVNKAMAEKNRLDSIAAVKSAALEKARLESEAKAKEKARVDSIVQAEASEKARRKAADDSLANAKLEADRQRLKDEALRKQVDKSRQDSITNAQAEAKQREKTRLDSLNKAIALERDRQKFVDDSTAKAIAASKIRDKFVADSLAQAKADQIKKQADDKNRLEAENKLKEKQAQDAIDAALAAKKERQKEIADSTQKAIADAKIKNAADEQARIKNQQDSLAQVKADEFRKSKEADENRRLAALKDKARQDSIYAAGASQRQKAEEERQQKLVEEKAKQDSINDALREQAEREDNERKAKVLAEIEAKKKLFEKTSAATDDKPKQVTKPTAPIPKIVDSDYREGVTEETITESTRIIYRTVVKMEGSAFNYQKIVYNWGGVFYFKNDNSITEITFDQELKNAKSILIK